MHIRSDQMSLLRLHAPPLLRTPSPDFTNFTSFKHPRIHAFNGTSTCLTSPAMQRTFTVIPDAPAPHPAQHVRPMTTKQVRKAYKASTKTPPISRAERVKQERAEQERIRKEFEKEKAAVRAKFTREKKREKELAERKQKKKLRMPLVKVRPSQDTIARFVRGNGSGKKRDSGGGTLADEATGQEEADKSNHDKPELDLIPEEDDSDLEKILDTITNSASHGEAPKEVEHNGGIRPPENHELQQQYQLATPPHKQPSRELKPFPRPIREMKPPSRPCQAKPQQPVHSPPLIIPQPPMSTQAILGNLDDFFPSSSQQALELQDETLDDSPSGVESPTPQQQQAQASPPPKRFFTPSGSNELESRAMQRNKRTTVKKGLKDQEVAQTHDTEEIPACKRLEYSKVHTILPPERPDSITKPSPSFGEDKENIQTETALHTCGISDSQETEYGGDWMDDPALDFIV